MRIINSKRGSLTIEATLSLSFFILGFMAVLSLTGIIRAERAVQYGVNQTAREISEYCYAADKAGLTSVLTESAVTPGDAAVQICGLSGNEGGESSETADIISEMTRIMLGDRSDRSLNGEAADGVCRLLVPKYISGSRDKTDRYLDNLCGITLGDMDFRYSSVLRDGRSVKIVAVYRVSIDPFGLLPGDGLTVDMKNSASTRAWIPYSLSSCDDEDQDDNVPESRWLIEGNQPRGQSWKKLLLSEHGIYAVCPGKGIDIYDYSENVMTEVYSLNIFTATYTNAAAAGSTDPESYTLKGNAAANKISSYAGHVRQSFGKLKDTLKMEDGSERKVPETEPELRILIVLPEETEKNRSIMDMLDSTAKKIKTGKNVTVEYQYRERALFTEEERNRVKEQLCGRSQEE